MLFDTLPVLAACAIYVQAATVPDVGSLYSEALGYVTNLDDYYSDLGDYYSNLDDYYSEFGGYYSNYDDGFFLFYTRSDVNSDLSVLATILTDFQAYTKWYISFYSKYRSELNGIYSSLGYSDYDALSEAWQYASLYGSDWNASGFTTLLGLNTKASFSTTSSGTARNTGTVSSSSGLGSSGSGSGAPKVTSGSSSTNSKTTVSPSSGSNSGGSGGSGTSGSGGSSGSGSSASGAAASSSSTGGADSTKSFLAMGAVLGGLPFLLL